MEDGPGTATIVFTDMVGSTALRARLGEERADELRRIHDRLLTGRIEAHGGRVLKSQGDGFMAAFTAASNGLTAAVEMQQVAASYSRRHDALAPIRLRIGLSVGDVSWEGGDVFGTPVIEAARLEAAAEGGQVLCSQPRAPGHGPAPLRGRRRPLRRSRRDRGPGGGCRHARPYPAGVGPDASRPPSARRRRPRPRAPWPRAGDGA